MSLKFIGRAILNNLARIDCRIGSSRVLLSNPVLRPKLPASPLVCFQNYNLDLPTSSPRSVINVMNHGRKTSVQTQQLPPMVVQVIARRGPTLVESWWSLQLKKLTVRRSTLSNSKGTLGRTYRK